MTTLPQLEMPDPADLSLDSLLRHHPQTLQAMRQFDQRIQQWQQQGKIFNNPPQVVQELSQDLDTVEFDVLIAGGTLGVILGAALVRRGWRVALVERGQLQGRDQEWNISHRELEVLVELDLISPQELEQAIATQFNPNRIQFLGGEALWVQDILNLGVSPRQLLARLKESFLQYGGQLFEHHALKGVTLHPNGIALTLTQPDQPRITARLLLDAMGHFSPLVAQTRADQAPDGVCMVVGTCAQGLPAQSTGDLMVSFTPIQNDCQYFWEAFPAATGRTTYLFTYVDLDPARPSLEQLFQDYVALLPDYQQCDLSQISVERALFGLFPSYRQSPLNFPWPRMLAVGDSSGLQSPLSFGGFGALLRHLKRLTTGIDEAIKADALTCADLDLLQPYQPNISATWMFQKAMSPQVNQPLDPQHINRLLNGVFQTMVTLGDDVLEPFLQDVVQFKGLSLTLAQMTLRQPQLIPKILSQVGLSSFLNWMPHYLSLGGFSALAQFEPALQVWSDRLPPQARYQWHRRLEAWRYGAGLE